VSDPSGKDEAPAENSVCLRLAAGPLAGPVLCRVVSMILVRADWPMDRLDDALLVCDALAAHAPAYVRDGRLAFTVASGPGRVELRVEALADRGARGLLADASVPGVGNVLERMSDEQQVLPGEDGSGEELVLTLSRG
jgi:hypothetical protein